MTAPEEPPDRDLARRLVAQQFPEWADLPVRDVEHSGWDNRTFRLGDHLSIRLPRSEFYADQVAKEQRWLPLLAPHLPVPIPRPVAQGAPGLGYPHAWSVYAWLDGVPAAPDRIEDPITFARSVAEFQVALRECDATDGPLPGQHNWWRGDPLDHYLDEARTALATVADEVDVAARHRDPGRGGRQQLAGTAGLVPRRHRVRQPAGPRRPALGGDRLRHQRDRRPRLRCRAGLDAAVGREPYGVPRHPRRWTTTRGPAAGAGACGRP